MVQVLGATSQKINVADRHPRHQRTYDASTSNSHVPFQFHESSYFKCSNDSVASSSVLSPSYSPLIYPSLDDHDDGCVFNASSVQNAYLDNVQSLAEHCDSLQSFFYFIDDDDKNYAGCAILSLQMLHDEMPKVTSLCHTMRSQGHRGLLAAQSVCRLQSECDILLCDTFDSCFDSNHVLVDSKNLAKQSAKLFTGMLPIM